MTKSPRLPRKGPKQPSSGPVGNLILASCARGPLSACHYLYARESDTRLFSGSVTRRYEKPWLADKTTTTICGSHSHPGPVSTILLDKYMYTGGMMRVVSKSHIRLIRPFAARLLLDRFSPYQFFWFWREVFHITRTRLWSRTWLRYQRFL